MALATQCPHCHTTFRVAHDQLKLRAGIVRCGQCRQVFNGIEHLLPPAGQQKTAQAENTGAAPATGTDVAAGLILPTAPAPITPVQVTSDATETALPASAEPDFDFDLAFDFEPATPAAKPDTASAATKTAPHDVLDELDYDALEGMTLMHFSQEEMPEDDNPFAAAVDPTAANAAAAAGTEPAQASSIGIGIEDVRLPGILRQSAAPDVEQDIGKNTQEETPEEPGFVTTARRQQHRQRGARLLFRAGSAILALLLLTQAGYALRNQIAAHLPQTKPSLLAICRTLGCSIALPAQIDAISIESSELQAQPGAAGTLALTLLLRNRSSTVQAWPNIELTLNDANQRAILRRIFTPPEFPLPAADIAKGFASDSEQSIRLSFTLTQLTAAGYRVVLYYP